jgi:segregation and condensation protein B
MNTDMTPEDSVRAVEAILFAAGCPVTYDKLAEALKSTAGEIKSLVKDIADNYKERGIELLIYNDSCRLCTKPEYEDTIKTALGLRRSGSLSVSSLEVLAVIAYHQPVTRAFIEQIRGVKCNYSVAALIENGMITRAGRKKALGNPMMYVTSDEFLRHFGISSLEVLPTLIQQAE